MLEKIWKRTCPSCGDDIFHTREHNRDRLEYEGAVCRKCGHKKMSLQKTGKSTEWSKAENTDWFLECPKCHTIRYYSSKTGLDRAIKTNSVCNSCVEIAESTKEKISAKNLGKKHPNRKSNSKNGRVGKYTRNCPDCDKILDYLSKYTLNQAIKNNTVCNSCCCYKYEKNWEYVITDESLKKMAATKAGYDSYEAYVADLPAFTAYRRDVAKVTRKQDLTILPNYDKLRGLAGVEGAFQLDHIISIKTGFEQNISSEIIGDIKNLQIIPWLENLLKSNGDI